MKIVTDRDACIGAASCVGVAPAVFELDDEYKVRVTDSDGADEDTILQAAEACPVQAITLFDDDENQLFP